MSKIDTILFDLGNVLIDWNPMYVYHDMFDDESDLKFFFENICTMDWNEEQDAGRPVAEATRSAIEAFPDWANAIEAYYGRWTEMLGGPIVKTVEILEHLYAQNGHQLLALTNWSGELFPVAIERYPFLQRFEGIVVSGQEKMRKPDPRIYQIVVDRYKAIPESTLFIDDSLRNINAAKAMGFQVIHFHNSSQLKNDLARKGVLA